MDSKILKLLDANEKNKWIIEDASLFFTWITNNLDSSNILTEKEFSTYKELPEASEEDLVQQLRDIEYEFPGFFSITEHDLIEKEKEATMLEEEMIERSDRMIRMEEFERNELKALARIEKEKIESDLEIQFLTDGITKKIEKLESLRKSNASKIEASNKHLLQSKSAFMYQMPSEKYLNNMNTYCMNLNVFMRQNLNIRKMNEAPIFHETERISALTKERNKIIELEGKLLESDLNVAGLKYALEKIDSFLTLFKPNILETNLIVGDWTQEEELLREQYEVALQELQMLTRQQSQSSQILDDFGKKKQAQNIEILKKLIHAQIITDDVASICCALWTASQLDSKRLENRVDNSEETENNSYECRKRICQLERFIKNDSKNSFDKEMLRSLRDILRKHLSLNTEKLSTVESCIGEILSFQEHLNVLVNSIVDQKYLARTKNAIKDIDLQISKLKPYIYKGPLNKPSLYDSSFFTQINQKGNRKKELEAQWQEIKTQYQKNISIPFNDDKFHRMKELLSTWFLTEPRKVILAIKEVQSKAAEIGSSSYKALNVTIQK